jgi:valyl-tRNA synthetase
VLETGYDILFFWVARMIMFGLEFTGQAPFHTVYLHGIIRDGEGRKMSKTLGNVIDPREVMDDFGTDALRFTLLTAGTPGNDLNLSLQRVESNRNFANKIWNMARFVTGNLAGEITPPSAAGALLSLADRWILARLNQTIADATRLMERYEFGQAGTLVSEFLWGDYADWYIEAAKVVLAGADESAKSVTRGVLLHVLDQGLRLLHPFVPFVTEAVWQHLPRQPNDPPALIIAPWPAPKAIDDVGLTAFHQQVREPVTSIRNAKASNNLKPAQSFPVFVTPSGTTTWIDTVQTGTYLSSLSRISPADLHISLQPTPVTPTAFTAVTSASVISMELPSAVVDPLAERQRLEKELRDIDAQIEKSRGLLGSDFAQKAPAAVVEKERAKLAALEESQAKVAERLGAR